MIDVKKWPALDFVKFICVAAMVYAHAHIMLISSPGKMLNMGSFFYKITDRFMFLGLLIMILPMLAGAVFGAKKTFEMIQLVKLAIFLAFLGFAMNIATWGWAYAFSWNVLQFIGVSFLIIAFLKKYYSNNAIVFLSLLAIFSAAPLRLSLAHFGPGYLVSILIGANDGHTFWPLLPWFGLVGLGFVFADWYEKNSDRARFNFWSGVAGVLLLTVAVIRKEISPFLDPGYIWGAGVFQPKIGWVFATIGLFLVLMALADFSLNKVEFRKYGIVNSYSKGILWIYIAQMFVSYHLSSLIKNFFPMDKPTLAYFILPAFMIVMSWAVGVLSIKLLSEKALVITLKKVK